MGLLIMTHPADGKDLLRGAVPTLTLDLTSFNHKSQEITRNQKCICKDRKSSGAGPTSLSTEFHDGR